MELKIDDNLTFKSAWNQFRRDWILYHLNTGLTIAGLSRKSGISRRTIQTLLNNKKPHNYKELTQPSNCLFCNKAADIRDHHIDGQAHSNKTVPLCEHCHNLFHNLNNKYRKPLKSETQEAVTEVLKLIKSGT